MLYLFNVRAFDMALSTIFRQIFSRMNPQERCDSTAPTCDTKIKTEAKPATTGKIWRARTSEWQVDHQSTRETDQGPEGERRDELDRPRQSMAREDNLIPGNHDWPIPALSGLSVLSVQPSPTSPACCSHFWVVYQRLGSSLRLPCSCLSLSRWLPSSGWS